MHVLIKQSHLFIIRSGYKKQRNEMINSTGNLKKVKLFLFTAKGLSSTN